MEKRNVTCKTLNNFEIQKKYINTNKTHGATSDKLEHNLTIGFLFLSYQVFDQFGLFFNRLMPFHMNDSAI